ncbi:MAG: hypothetical protein AAF699_08720 [Pseudomonadota bacterium]
MEEFSLVTYRIARRTCMMVLGTRFAELAGGFINLVTGYTALMNK